MATRKSSTPAAAPAPSKAAKFLMGCLLIAIGMALYGIMIDARAVTWPAASTAAGTVGSWVDGLQQDDDQAPVAAAAVKP